MPAIARIGDVSAGHGCFPPTNLTQTYATKTYFNGKLVAVVDPSTRFAPHSCGRDTHAGITRAISSGSSKTYIEGKPAARIGDNIACGDACAEGSPNTFFD